MERLLAVSFSGERSYIDWKEVVRCDGLDRSLIERSFVHIRRKINKTVFSDEPYKLIHTDFNQLNLFVDPKSDKIKAVIDWEEAMFGDPMYDFARIRMYIRHFDLGAEAYSIYYAILDLSQEEKELE